MGNLPEMKARELAEARIILAKGGVEQALRIAQKAAKEFPASLAPRLVLAEAYHRQSLKGGAGLKPLADREFNEAIKLLPDNDKPANLAILATASVVGRTAILVERYKARAGDPLAGEMLKVADAIEGSRGVKTPLQSTGNPRPLLRLTGALMAVAVALVGFWLWFSSRGFPAGSLKDGTKFEAGGPVPPEYLSAPAIPSIKPVVFGGRVPQRAIVLSAHGGQVNAISYSTDGRFLATAGDDGKVRVWYAGDGSMVAEAQAGSVMLNDVEVSPDGASIVAVDNGGSIFQWKFDGIKMEGGPREEDLMGHGAFIAFSPNGRTLLVTSFDGRMLLGDMSGQSALAALSTKIPLRMGAYSPDGRLVAYGTNANFFSLWDLKSGRRGSCVVPKVAQTADVSGLAFTPDGRELVLGFMDSSIVVWNLRRKKDRLNFYVRDVSVTALAVAPDNATFATGGPDGKVYLWELSDGRSRAIIPAHGGWTKAIAFSPDGGTMATGGGDGLVVLWR
jgi:photosystem II stability/assembly factor-like uncharacterized protein